MIIWPDEKRVKSVGRDALRYFRDTSAAAELEQSQEKWRVVAWPWTDELPLRVVLENEAHKSIVISMDDEGRWMLVDEPYTLHQRTAEALEAEAFGRTYERAEERAGH